MVFEREIPSNIHNSRRLVTGKQGASPKQESLEKILAQKLPRELKQDKNYICYMSHVVLS